MKVKGKLTPDEVEDLLRPRLLLFMSADLEGSTAYKQQPGRSSDHEILKPFFVFLKEFGGEMDAQRRKLEREMSNHIMPPAPQPWKILGDELIYFVELNRAGDADFHILAFQRALQKINSEEPPPKLKVKGSAWLAGFPICNALLPLENGETSGAGRSYDYLGASIDIGFRLSKFSSPNRMCISVDLAWLLLDSHEKDFFYGYEGRKELKGVTEKTGYPIIWIAVGSTKLHEAEAELLRQERCDPKKLKAYCEAFISESGHPRFLPFIFSENDAPAEFDPGLKAAKDFIYEALDVDDSAKASDPPNENAELRDRLRAKAKEEASAARKKTRSTAKPSAKKKPTSVKANGRKGLGKGATKKQG